MSPRQLFILAILLGLGSIVCLLIPTHSLFNQPQGPTVLGDMALAAGLSGLILRWRQAASTDRERENPQS